MTIALTNDDTKIVFGVIVVVAGLLGGLAAELMKSRKVGGADEDGALELPKLLSRRYFDVGFPASMFLGAVAAAVAVWVFDLVDQVPEGGKIVDKYDIVKVVGVSLIAGFSAPKFLQTAQERLLAQMTAQRFESGLRTVAAATKSAQTPPAGDSAAAGHQMVEAIARETLAPGSASNVPG